MYELFETYRLPMDIWIRDAVDWLVMNFRPVFQAIRWPVEQVLAAVRDGLLAVPPPVFLVVLLAVAWRAANWRVGVFAAASFALVGFIGLWEPLMVTFAMVVSAVFFCVVVGIPLGILAARSDTFFALIRPVLDAFQTTPAFVYLVPVVMLFSIGTGPGVIATIIFALPPIIRLTNLGLRQVPEEVVEAGTSFGCTPMQLLWKVQFPLALPTIMAGLNQTIMLSLSMVVIAALIGAGGLGVVVFSGLNRLQVGTAAIGGIGIVLLAMVLDRITQALAGKTGPPAQRSS
ncbi:MAG TPA: proline/glycine betaine ABC transporter permease [Limnochordales bacterium]|nr:proline/glycine betaine ABC transporter permease [Limnochordales bacterium]